MDTENKNKSHKKRTFFSVMGLLLVVAIIIGACTSHNSHSRGNSIPHQYPGTNSCNGGCQSIVCQSLGAGGLW